MLGVIPLYALIMVVRPGIFLPLRILFALLFSAVVVVLLWWASIEYRSGWIFGGYTVFMVVTNVVSVVLLIVRFFMRR
jgi:hypothetical protein